MKRLIPFALCAFVISAPLFAQSTQGWKVRVDRSTSATDPDGAGSVKFVAEGKGFHATNPQAAVYWTPANTATGNYTLKGNFTLLEPSNHNNFYGLVFGGKDLDGAGQVYTYFTVSQEGSWLLKHRDGANATTVSGKTKNAAVKSPGADGKSVNALEVRVLADKVDFVVNGAVVHSEPKTFAATDGNYGVRVNHFLNVQFDGLSVSK